MGRDWREHVRVMPGGRGEYPRLISRPARLSSLGWQPLVSFEQLSEMMMNETLEAKTT